MRVPAPPVPQASPRAVSELTISILFLSSEWHFWVFIIHCHRLRMRTGGNSFLFFFIILFLTINFNHLNKFFRNRYSKILFFRQSIFIIYLSFLSYNYLKNEVQSGISHVQSIIPLFYNIYCILHPDFKGTKNHTSHEIKKGRNCRVFFPLL